MQHRRAYQAPHTVGVANGHLVKRWTHEELLLPGQVADLALIAALCSEEGDEADGARAEGCCLGAHCALNAEHKFQRLLRRLSRGGGPRQLCKLGRHRRVAPCELLDRQVVGLVVGQAQIVGRLVQRFLGFFQVLDRFVNAPNSFFKALRGQARIAAKRRLEFVQLGFELGDVHVLRAHQAQ